MSYQLGYDPVAMGAYLDAMGQAGDGTDHNGMTVGGAPAGLSVAANYGASVSSTGTAMMVLALCVGVYLVLNHDRLHGLGP